MHTRDSFRTSGLGVPRCAKELARRYAGSVKLAKVNVDASPRLSERFGVQGIPTMLIMKGKDILARQTGAAPEPVLRDWLAKVLQLPAA